MNFRGGGASCNPAPVRVFSKFTWLGRLVSFVGDFFSLNRSLARYRFEKKSPKNFAAKKQDNNVTNSSPFTVHRSLINETAFSPFTSHFSLTQPPAFTLAEVLITLGIIGIVAAMTLPSLVGKYQKKVTVERLKKVYTVLSQAVLMSVKDHEAIEYWDFELSSQEFMDTYLKPYFQNIASEITSSDTAKNSKKYALADGTTFSGWMFKNPNPANHDITTFYRLEVDINGEQKPNLAGRDIFYYYIFPIKSNFFNGGQGNIAYKVPGPGLYPDGYGYDRERLKTDGWRGCNKTSDDEAPPGHEGSPIAAGAFCTALIMLDGWEIADDYRW